MFLKLTKKKDIVKNINNTANKAISLIIADITGIKVNEINQLRKICRKKKEIYLYSTRNSLMIRGIHNTDFLNMQYLLKGQCIIGFSLKTPDITTKVFHEFSKKYEKKLYIKGVCVEKKIFSGESIDLLIRLPNFEGALINLLLLFKYISIGNIYTLLYKVLNKKKNINYIKGK